MEWHTGDPATLHQLLISEHAGTHLDAPLHFYNSPGDARRVPLDAVPVESFVGRAVKLEFQGLAPTTELAADDIRRWERQQFPLRPGDAAVFWLITLPLKIKDGSGSPIRAIALFG